MDSQSTNAGGEQKTSRTAAAVRARRRRTVQPPVEAAVYVLADFYAYDLEVAINPGYEKGAVALQKKLQPSFAKAKNLLKTEYPELLDFIQKEINVYFTNSRILALGEDMAGLEKRRESLRRSQLSMNDPKYRQEVREYQEELRALSEALRRKGEKLKTYVEEAKKAGETMTFDPSSIRKMLKRGIKFFERDRKKNLPQANREVEDQVQKVQEETDTEIVNEWLTGRGMQAARESSQNLGEGQQVNWPSDVQKNIMMYLHFGKKRKSKKRTKRKSRRRKKKSRRRKKKSLKRGKRKKKSRKRTLKK